MIAKEAEKDVARGIFCFPLMTMLVNRNPLNGFAMLIRSIGVSLMMLHVNRIIVGLRKAAGDRFNHAKDAVHPVGPKEWIMNEVVSDAIDIGVDHECVDKTQNQHHPQRGEREKKIHRQKVGKVK